MARYGKEFVVAVATVAAQAAQARSTWSVEECVNFAWYSMSQTGDASVDQNDFDRHLTTWEEQ